MALVLIAGASSKAEAAFVAAICNDLACSGGDDFVVTDNVGLDTTPIVGAINFTLAAFGYNLVVNTSQSKPVIGSATAPQLDLTYSASSAGNPGGSVFLFASDTDFTGTGTKSFTMSLSQTSSGGSGSVTGRAWGGQNNTQLSLAGGSFATIGPLTGAASSATNSGTFNAAVSPYSLTIGVQVTRTTAGTTTGDLNLSAVPEPATMALFGLGLFGFGAASRRRKRQ